MVGFLRLALVTFLAALVWAWAEGEGLTTAPAAPRIVFAAAPGSNVRVRPVDGAWRDYVSVTLRGSTASVTAVQRRMLAAIILTPGVGTVPALPGRHTLDLRDALLSIPEIRGAGVSLLSVEPAAVRIDVETVPLPPVPAAPVVPVAPTPDSATPEATP
ncbi:hypothetical protein BH11PLA1_BH11PLA1_22520 [soil metagenome]